MLESCLDQGAGLRKISGGWLQRVITLASHGQKDVELPFLWALCAALTRLGYPLLVLDATISETAKNPGLLECLEFNDVEESDASPVAWTVLPAALGFAKLCHQGNQGGASLENIQPLFHAYSVIVLFLPTDTMVTAMAQRPIEPLVAVSDQDLSLLRAYQSLKKIISTTHLKPGVISMVYERPQIAKSCGDTPPETLKHCAKQFLGQYIQTHKLRMVGNDPLDDEEMENLALRLLENAMPLTSTQQTFLPRSH